MPKTEDFETDSFTMGAFEPTADGTWVSAGAGFDNYGTTSLSMEEIRRLYQWLGEQLSQ